MSNRLQQVLRRIDQLNSEDPNKEIVEGVLRPRELVYSERLTAWVLRLAPEASEALRIASRGQHLCRWTIPRQQYEMTRRGYLKWRETLKAFHAQRVGTLMHEAGYSEPEIARVQRLMSKRELPGDPDTQSLEDALCLVFLETQFADLRNKEPEAKMIDILRKTWKKMSERARQEALQLPLGTQERELVERAVHGA